MELDTKFSEFESVAVQRENEYMKIIERQRLDSEQLKGFETLKESNMEMRSVIKLKLDLIKLPININNFSFQKIQKLQENYQMLDSPTKTPTKRSLFFGKENQSPVAVGQMRLQYEQSPKNILKPRN